MPHIKVWCADGGKHRLGGRGENHWDGTFDEVLHRREACYASCNPGSTSMREQDEGSADA